MSKVKFNLKNVHIAKRTESSSGITYGTPIAWPGAVSISLEAKGEINKFYADGIVYFQSASNSGYEGDIEMALFPDEIRELILNEETDANEVILEKADAMSESFALLFEVETDEVGYKFAFYNCTITRPSFEAQTKEENTEPKTETAKISCAANENGVIRAKTTDDTPASAINSWYTSVYQTSAA